MIKRHDVGDGRVVLCQTNLGKQVDMAPVSERIGGAIFNCL
jgi:hypothetical protein